jgi:hypothetical protein
MQALQALVSSMSAQHGCCGHPITAMRDRRPCSAGQHRAEAQAARKLASSSQADAGGRRAQPNRGHRARPRSNNNNNNNRPSSKPAATVRCACQQEWGAAKRSCSKLEQTASGLAPRVANMRCATHARRTKTRTTVQQQQPARPGAQSCCSRRASWLTATPLARQHL